MAGVGSAISMSLLNNKKAAWEVSDPASPRTEAYLAASGERCRGNGNPLRAMGEIQPPIACRQADRGRRPLAFHGNKMQGVPAARSVVAAFRHQHHGITR